MTTVETNRQRSPIDVQDLVDTAVTYEEQRHWGETRTQGGKIAHILDTLEIASVLPTATHVLKMNENQIYEVLLFGNGIPEDLQEIVNQTYAFSQLLRRETGNNHKKIKKILLGENPKLKRDPYSESSPSRSALQALIDGNIEQVLFVAEYDSQRAHEEI